jgi:hypothetical protein
MAPAALALALLLGASASKDWHPQDGPHLDLELRIEGERVQLMAQLNLACADELVGSLREDPNHLDAVEVEPLRAALLEHLVGAARVLCNGRPLDLEGSAFHWSPPDLERLPYYPRFGVRALTTLRAHLEGDAAAPIRRLDLTWSSFPPDLIAGAVGGKPLPLTVRARVVALGEHAMHELTPATPGLTWTPPADGGRARWIEVPASGSGALGPRLGRPALWIGLLALGAGLARARTRRGWPLAAAGALLAGATAWPPQDGLDAEEAREVFLALHQNLYRAFEDTREEAIYEGLARAVRGGLREEVYEHLQETLTMAEEGGARAEVEDLRHREVRLLEATVDPPRFEVEAAWEVDGAVHHFGHFHRRTTAYRARYRAEREADGWRLVAHEPLDQRRLAVTTNDPAAASEEAREL